ncbi:hypothetical protein GDO86_017660 [Hymenochirus boettgeri]|uniref:Uncharacterized protein n=1 Tax=Hymenochirus boettgeri TaxID=247094 RepID=A0A8T2ISN8_9PIPI|nr:hypothetical protein GDO86_017660 [Hymenochirus boettgeri]
MKTIVLLAVLVNILFSQSGSGNVVRPDAEHKAESSGLKCRTCKGNDCEYKNFTLTTCEPWEDACTLLLHVESTAEKSIVTYAVCQARTMCLMLKKDWFPERLVKCCKDTDCKEFHH